jgi:hypothetical protein
MFKKGELVEVKFGSFWSISSSNIGVVMNDTGSGLPKSIMLEIKENITCCFMDNEVVYVATRNLKSVDHK